MRAGILPAMEFSDRRRNARSAALGDGEVQTLARILDALKRQGYDGQFGAHAGATVTCFTCHHVSPAASFRVETLRRLEGASDPADMLVVAPVMCPHCGARGSLVLNYGPESTAEEADVLLALAAPRHPPDPGVDSE
jgi:hypothetical protein